MQEIYEFIINLDSKTKLVARIIFILSFILIIGKLAETIYLEHTYCMCTDLDYGKVKDGIHIDEYEFCMKPLEYKYKVIEE